MTRRRSIRSNTIEAFTIVRADRSVVECLVVGASGIALCEVVDLVMAHVRAGVEALVASDSDAAEAKRRGDLRVVQIFGGSAHPTTPIGVRVVGLSEIEDRVYLREHFAAALREHFMDEHVMEAF